MRPRILSIIVLSIVLLASAAPVLGDGMPSYTLGTVDPEKAFSSLFESRQLARVDLVNETSERISLFLSVYSLDPGDNLTLMVPLRTLPSDVTGSPMKEGDFRKAYGLDRAAMEVVRQDPDEAWVKFFREASDALGACAGSMLLTAPGEYLREKVHLVQESSGGKSESLGAGSIELKPEPVQHYEFDGFSIDVFGVEAGPRLADYLAQRNLTLPSTGDLARYDTHYIAVVQGETEPPINATEFELLRTNAPNTTAKLAQMLRTDPKKSTDEIDYLKGELGYGASSEYRERDDANYSRPLYNNLWNYMDDLIDAVFGRADFAGEVLRIGLPLDNGSVFFPLGTSAGWPNAVGTIDVLFKVPEGKRLSLPSVKDAYFDGSHCYLFHMENANPAFDLDSHVLEGSANRQAEARHAALLYDNAATLGGLLVALGVIVAWFAAALLARRLMGAEGATLRSPALWLMLALSVIVSVPGAVLAYLVAYAPPSKDLLRRVVTATPLVFYAVAVVLFIVGVTV